MLSISDYGILVTLGQKRSLKRQMKMADKIVEVLKESYDMLNPAKEQEERALENFR